MNIKKLSIFFAILLAAFLFTGCNQTDKQEEEGNINETDSTEQEEKTPLTISAAISLTDALEEMKAIFEEEHHAELTFNLGGSGKLAQQIQQGAPSDVFISANQDWMDMLEEEELILADTREDVTGNKIVLISSKDADLSIDSLEDIDTVDSIKQIAVGNPETVPAGKYTEQALQSIKKWDELEDKIVLAKDVRQVLTYVETGNADIGFVYESDAKTSDDINILLTADSDMHDSIIYPAAVTKDTQHEELAKAFVEFLESDQAQDILKSYGFQK
ncbi:molybdate ABC transporter substrate-binding protein [Cerasibacillus terrae]|uniref:Molybdate ABC transporter substrate-binding protein n=1 Tax=Cerasibacillus terrae TaxID=2498845 RepID=A0A5C8NQH8_9BACI|nr:molybdate ABC transporter substrate-binding protein [Cerasibacillus terrae]TXL63377.1 molybdate ABC transporter substrate-binding protein [Cerasibacillus terrae]